MPLAWAKRSHFVGGLGLGKGLARGSWYTGGGSWANDPSGDEVVGRENKALMRACVPSRASDWRCSSKLELSRRQHKSGISRVSYLPVALLVDRIQVCHGKTAWVCIKWYILFDACRLAAVYFSTCDSLHKIRTILPHARLRCRIHPWQQEISTLTILCLFWQICLYQWLLANTATAESPFNWQAAHNMAENSSSSASTSATPTNAPATDTAGATDVIGVLGALLKNQTGESISNERVAQLVLANMATLVKQGKLTQQQILQVLPESTITAREG